MPNVHVVICQPERPLCRRKIKIAWSSLRTSNILLIYHAHLWPCVFHSNMAPTTACESQTAWSEIREEGTPPSPSLVSIQPTLGPDCLRQNMAGPQPALHRPAAVPVDFETCNAFLTTLWHEYANIIGHDNLWCSALYFSDKHRCAASEYVLFRAASRPHVDTALFLLRPQVN